MEETVLKQNQKYFSKLGFCYFIGTILIIAVQTGSGVLVKTLAPDFFEKYAFLIMMLPMYFIAVPIIVFMITRIPAKQTVTQNKMGFGALLVYFLIGYAGMYVFNLFGNMIAAVISAFKQAEVTNALAQVATTNSIWSNFIVMVICAPIAEEILFRKLLIDRTIQYGEKFCVLLSALMFGLYHGNIYQFFYACALGCVFAYVYVKTGRIIYTMILHAMINFMGTIASVFVVKESGFLESLNNFNPAEMTAFVMENLAIVLLFILYIMLILSFTVAGIILFIVFAKKIRFVPAVEPIEKGCVFKTVALNVGMGLFFIFWIVYIILVTIL